MVMKQLLVPGPPWWSRCSAPQHINGHRAIIGGTENKQINSFVRDREISGNLGKYWETRQHAASLCFFYWMYYFCLVTFVLHSVIKGWHRECQPFNPFL
jgi:hypothetical protein